MLDYSYPIEVEDLSKIFGPNPERAKDLIDQGYGKEEIFEQTGLTVGVQNANFQVKEGETFVVMGLSGSGKSTIIRMLNRLIEPTYGRVYVEGKDITQMPDQGLIQIRREKMSMVFQSFALMPHLTVWENASFGLEISGYHKNERYERALKALEQVGLKANANSFPNELSGGMQQRVGLARGLAGNPTILFMDEAFSALDPLIRSEMQDLLLNLQAESPRTVVFISHDLDEAMRIGDRIAMMEGGKIVQIGTPEEILKYPVDDYVQAFFRGVDPTNVLRASDVVSDLQVTFNNDTELRSAMDSLYSNAQNYGYVLDKERKFTGVVSTESIRTLLETQDTPNGSLDKAFLSDIQTGELDNSLQEILPLITKTQCPLPIVDKNNVYQGIISRNLFLRTMQREE